MKDTGNIRFVRFSNDFKNSAGRKAAIFFFAEDVLFFFILLPAVLLPQRLLKAGTAAVLTTPLLLGALWLFTFCRLKPNRVWQAILFTFLTAAVSTAVFFSAGNYGAAAVCLFAMIFSLARLKRDFSRMYEKITDRSGRIQMPAYRKRADDEPHDRDDENHGPAYLGKSTVVFSAVLSLAVYLTALVFDDDRLAVFCILDFAAVAALFLLYEQKSGAFCLSRWDALSHTKNAADDGGVHANRAGSALLTFLTVVGTAVITGIGFTVFAAGGGFRADRAFLAAVIRAFSGRPEHREKAELLREDALRRQPDPAKNPLADAAPSNTAASELIRNILNVFMWCVIILAAVFVLIAIGSAVIGFYRKLGMNPNESSKSLLFTGEKAGKARPNRRHAFRSHSPFFRSGNRAAIRRLFFLHVKMRRGKSVKSSETPFETCGEIHDGSDMPTAAALYEKARYGKEDCADEDVKNMRQALKPDRRSPS